MISTFNEIFKMKKLMIIILAWLMAAPTAAQNLIVNGDFNTDTNGWVGVPSTTLTWVNDDGAPTSGNGSMMNINSFNNGSSFPAISEKMTVIPNHWYLTGFSYKVPADSPVSWVLYRFHWYDDLNNQIGFSDFVGTDFNFPRDVWENFTGLNQVPELATLRRITNLFSIGGKWRNRSTLRLLG